MKNNLSKPAIIRIANVFSTILNDFNKEEFIFQTLSGIDELELKQRVSHIIHILNTHLPNDFYMTSQILLQVKENWDWGEPDDSYNSFAAWPIIDYVSIYGIEYPEISLEVLKNLTCLFSAEFAIRPFIVKYPEYCLSQFKLWINDEDEHVRRLVSEGTRPRLPWGLQLKQFIKDPTPNLPLLDHLKMDKSLYVRRSVANHLNDIAKDNADVVINTCKTWCKSVSKNKELQWLVKHATRTLIKAGHKDAFSLLGYTQDPKIKVSNINLSHNKVEMGKEVSFEFELNSDSDKQQNLVIDYALHFIKANGQQSAKVFKLKTLFLARNETCLLSKKHSFKAISTRKYYIGEHKIEIFINGVSVKTKSFDLV
ncbi:hypothetical protein [Pseudoalteromonas denitrificans]|uniref:3-methyladenine DNA glycosylase AlkC n=1 Tax=Pseudoalteromonas denitrificans DSM 6059 TaxID=1123010 RepID=A0A1I1NFR3_9GAMM|nr:hypothetical protein [Pseudoalteromonas denitrificans]SFC96554.1 3-methyladenine DNA glycosylase AlkC [Pseudoalteromonas denitrificans DSM 6059]